MPHFFAEGRAIFPFVAICLPARDPGRKRDERRLKQNAKGLRRVLIFLFESSITALKRPGSKKQTLANALTGAWAAAGDGHARRPAAQQRGA
jgi:hypothetical protein